MTKVTIPLNIAKSINSLFAVVDSKKNAPLTYQRVQVEVQGNKVTAFATDRYMIAYATYELPDEMPEVTFSLSLPMSKFIQADKSKLGNLEVTIGENESDLELTIDNATSKFTTFSQPYPQNLIPLVTEYKVGDSTNPVFLDLDLVSRLTKITDTKGDKITDWVIDYAQDSTQKSKPIRLMSGDFIALAQPKYQTKN